MYTLGACMYKYVSTIHHIQPAVCISHDLAHISAESISNPRLLIALEITQRNASGRPKNMICIVMHIHVGLHPSHPRDRPSTHEH